MELKRIILQDNVDRYMTTDLLEFDKPVKRADVEQALREVKQAEDYTEQDVYRALARVGNYKITNLELYEY